MGCKEKRTLWLESQDDIAYLTGKRNAKEKEKQIKTSRLRCSECGRFVSHGATHCKTCGAKL
ncbi:MAG TPA: hypothetical protein EYP53_10435 [Candidatus Latescibacteria bacterium]|nr:hypothetical protein [Candidatus Latescibacterota bacterium]